MEQEKLMDLLDEARIQIEYLQNKFRETGSGNNVIARIEAALQEPVSAPSVKGPWHTRVETSQPHPESGEWAEENTFIITDGSIDLTPQHELDEEVEQRIINALNSAGCKLSFDCSGYFNLRNENYLLQEEVAALKAGQIAGVQWVMAISCDRSKIPSGNQILIRFNEGKDRLLGDKKLIIDLLDTEGQTDVEYLDESCASLSTPSDFKEITGHNSVEEHKAFDEGYAAREKVTMEWIRKWDGSTNSGLGKLLADKFKELASLSTAKEQETATFENWVVENGYEWSIKEHGWRHKEGSWDALFDTAQLYDLFLQSQTK